MIAQNGPVDSAHVTQGAGIPDDTIDALIGATLPADNNFDLVMKDAAQHARMVVEDIEDAFEVMPADTPLGVGIDLVNAQAHLLTARRLLAHAADTLAVDAQAVTR